MIKNERQYKITKSQIAKFAAALDELAARDGANTRRGKLEADALRSQLDELQELTLPLGEKTFVIRTPPVGDAGRALQAAGVALGPSVRLL